MTDEYSPEKMMDALVFNIEHFHTMNEMFGRKTGDLVLAKTADHLKEILDADDCIGCRPDADKTRSVDERFDHAKLACDRIRDDYTRQISYYSRELSDRDLYHERLINDIDEAISNKDLIVYYQPKYAVQTDEPVLRSAAYCTS